MTVPENPLADGWPSEAYELLDFGKGRKLESFGGVVVSRVCPAADRFHPNGQVDWNTARVRLDRKGDPLGDAIPNTDLWKTSVDGIQFSLKLTPFGHVGLFPEQMLSWQWLRRVFQEPPFSSRKDLRVLNLFSYTGGTTLQLAKCNSKSLRVEVVHVDASAPAVTWARRNALQSGLLDAPIRWIVEDARKFVARELRRGNRYDFIILDPPSFGHGPNGKRWELSRDLPLLLDNCMQLLARHTSCFLLTGHSEQPSCGEILAMVKLALRNQNRPFNDSKNCQGRMTLTDRAGRNLDAGFFIRGLVTASE